MIIEVNGPCLLYQGYEPKNLFEVIEAFGYSIFINYESSFIKIDPRRVFPICNADVVCVHSSKLQNFPVLKDARAFTTKELLDMLKRLYQNTNGSCRKYFQHLEQKYKKVDK